jgi:hypothetical protein
VTAETAVQEHPNEPDRTTSVLERFGLDMASIREQLAFYYPHEGSSAARPPGAR